ncbi:hypothetical protein BBJ29_001734 [Phytophthora kernoviae]|uniref:RCK N-terminal domain-containing protein n=1 Tax=Phytophthora kernoviae TaxID=325452 RepID=A0A3F2RSG1_9STRA|nr:hypothetical protein BBP00_00004188 [Phytophthora kernoviae]RLN70209.1 hypothetical protein BBJ29_001734 [Phytophthora kernoviae]
MLAVEIASVGTESLPFMLVDAVTNPAKCFSFMDHSSFGAGLDIFLVLVSVVFASSYIANTYVPSNDMPFSLWVTDIVCASLFGADFLFRGIYLSSRRRDYMLSCTLWVDISYWRFVYPLRFVTCYIEAKAVLSRCHGLVSPVQQFAMLCYLQLTTIIAVAAGVIQIAETDDIKYMAGDLGDWTFFNAFFNSVLTFVTIQSPPADNNLAKVCVGALVLVLILVVPYQISQILALGSSFSPYEVASHSPSPTSKHIVLCGDLTPSRIDHFFSEVFHDDHDVVDINVVVLSEEEPAASLIAQLMDPFFEKRASFIQGSLMDADDAQRAACSSADAIFVLSRRVASVIFGKTFSEVASLAYSQCSGVIVFAITTAQSPKESGGKLLLNPGDSYTCVGEEMVFVIAQDRRQATAVTETDDYEHFQRFFDVHFVVGDPFRQRTLRRASVDRAFRIVIMGAEGEISDADSSELLQDADCIALHKTLTSFIGPTQAPRIITELVNRANVHFVAQNLAASGWFPLSPENKVASSSTSSLELARNFALSPAFASGLTYSTSLCDSLLINQFFNARIKNILREFIFASWTDGGVGTLPSTPATAGRFGEPVVSPTLSSSSTTSVQRSSLFAVEVPLDFVGRSFEFVFQYLLSSDGILVIGLYRCRPDAMLRTSSLHTLDEAQWPNEKRTMHRARIEVPENERSVPFGYVCTNPQPHEVLTGNDLLYVLSDIQPCWAEVYKV